LPPLTSSPIPACTLVCKAVLRLFVSPSVSPTVSLYYAPDPIMVTVMFTVWIPVVNCPYSGLT
jgi:hypothetical protein